MGRNRSLKKRRTESTFVGKRVLVEQELTPLGASISERDMAKPKPNPAARKAKMDRQVQDAFAQLSARPKKKVKKFPATALQKRMQSGDV